MKIRQRHVDWTIGFLAAFVAFCFLQTVWEYRDSHCTPLEQDTQNKPSHEQSIVAATQKQSNHGDKKLLDQTEDIRISCGLVGMVPAAISFMDHHEGFFVGLFTFFLAISTTFLWRFTVDLYEAGENQARMTREKDLLLQPSYVSGGGLHRWQIGKFEI